MITAKKIIPKKEPKESILFDHPVPNNTGAQPTGQLSTRYYKR